MFTSKHVLLTEIFRHMGVMDWTNENGPVHCDGSLNAICKLLETFLG